MNNSKSREVQIRRLAQKQGLRVVKSRERTVFPYNVNNLGKFMLVKADSLEPVFGRRYAAELEEIEKYLIQQNKREVIDDLGMYFVFIERRFINKHSHLQELYSNLDKADDINEAVSELKNEINKAGFDFNLELREFEELEKTQKEQGATE